MDECMASKHGYSDCITNSDMVVTCQEATLESPMDEQKHIRLLKEDGTFAGPS